MLNEDIKNVLLGDMDVSYKLLTIGKTVIYDPYRKQCLQVHCDRYDLQESKIFLIEEIDRAISYFLNLKIKYMASEYREGRSLNGFSNIRNCETVFG